METSVIVKLHGGFELVGLDATHVERFFGLEVLDKSYHGLLEGGAGRLGSLRHLCHCPGALGPLLFQEVVLTAVGGVDRGSGVHDRGGGGAY